MSEAAGILICHRCGAGIACCEFCDRNDCVKAVCYGCVIVDLGRRLAQIHIHGG